FAPASFDAALAAFVVNHLPRPDRAAAEIRRLFAPGGRVAVAMWDQPERVEFLGLLDAAMDAAHVERGLHLPPGPPAYRFADEGELRALLDGAGLTDVAIETVRFAYAIADVDERARVRGALDELLEERRSTGGLELETAVKIACGVSRGA